MLDGVKCRVNTAAELNQEIRNILSLDDQGRGNEICGTLHVYYSDESVKQAGHVSYLEERGVAVEWHKE